MQQQFLGEGIVRCAEVFGQSCLADTTTWLEDFEAGLCADQRDGRRSKITQPNLKYETERGCCQVGMVYCRDGTSHTLGQAQIASSGQRHHLAAACAKGEVIAKSSDELRNGAACSFVPKKERDCCIGIITREECAVNRCPPFIEKA